MKARENTIFPPDNVLKQPLYPINPLIGYKAEQPQVYENVLVTRQLICTLRKKFHRDTIT
jgi:hypothetical protein